MAGLALYAKVGMVVFSRFYLRVVGQFTYSSSPSGRGRLTHGPKQLLRIT